VRQRVLVTGGSQGIGRAIALSCADAGHDVTVLSRRPPAGSPIPHLACDLRDPRQVAHALSSWVGSVAAPVDAVIHCAVDYGSNSRHPFAENTVEEWDAAMQVNARGLMLMLQQVLPQMTRRGRGLVIGLSSDVAEHPGPERIPYAASKAAAHAVLTGLAAELADSGVTVMELAPTVQVDTPGIRSRRPRDFQPVGYADAGCFRAPVLRLLDGDARRHHGSCLWVDQDGLLLDASGAVIP
jgi:NAD(P)-dependent dehydrogenase (short-subunit alcohol dehydrogenase family)